MGKAKEIQITAKGNDSNIVGVIAALNVISRELNRSNHKQTYTISASFKIGSLYHAETLINGLKILKDQGALNLIEYSKLMGEIKSYVESTKK